MLAKNGYTGTKVSMSDMITWSDMRHATSISHGPGKEKIFNEIHWLPVLKLFIEV